MWWSSAIFGFGADTIRFAEPTLDSWVEAIVVVLDGALLVGGLGHLHKYSRVAIDSVSSSLIDNRGFDLLAFAESCDEELDFDFRVERFVIKLSEAFLVGISGFWFEMFGVTPVSLSLSS